jgi:Gram-negative bacterial TonB protein C-terminal
LKSRTALFVLLILTIQSFLPRQATAQSTYTLKPTPKTVEWGYYDAKATPVLRIKSGETVEIQTPATSTATPDEKKPLIYVKHLEPPYYPPLARMTRVHGSITMKLKIGADGKVLAIESSSLDTPNTSAFAMLKEDAERNIKTWTFGCVGCASGAAFDHTIKYKYILDDNNLPPSTAKTVMDLPNEVTMSAGPVLIQPEKTSSKGRH